MDRLRSVASAAAGVGLIVIIADRFGWLPPGLPYRLQVLGVAVLALFVGGGFVALADGWAWFRERRPSGDQRHAAAAVAARLGLQSVEGSTVSVDRSLPLLRPGTQWREPLSTVLGRSLALLSVIGFALWLSLGLFAGFVRQSTEIQTVMIGGSIIAMTIVAFLIRSFRRSSHLNEPLGWFAKHASAPRAAGFNWVFVGTWRGIELRVFDYWAVLGSLKNEWTCTVMPTDGALELEIKRGPAGRKGRTSGRIDSAVIGEESERLFNLLAETKEGARPVLNAALRSALRDDDGWDLIQVAGRRFLYCGQRVPLTGREELLRAANRLRDSLPTR